jgi:hypothetical protein
MAVLVIAVVVADQGELGFVGIHPQPTHHIAGVLNHLGVFMPNRT